MNKENIKYYLGILLIIGLTFYSFATKNKDIFFKKDSFNKKLSASVEEVDINIGRNEEDNYDGEHYPFEVPSNWKIISGDRIRIQSGDKKILHLIIENPSNLPVKRWVARDMASKIMSGRKEVKIGDYYLNKNELESFFVNILEKREKDQIEALSYLNYNSMQHLYLEDKNKGRQVIQLTSRGNNLKEEFYTVFDSKILIFTYNSNYNEDIKEYRSVIKEMIRSLE